MNTELKAMIDLIFDGEKILAGLVKKQTFLYMLPALFEFATVDLPSVIASYSDLKPEIEALPGSDAEMDLVVYIQAKFNSAVSNEKSQAILATALKLVLDLVQDAQAFKNAVQS